MQEKHAGSSQRVAGFILGVSPLVLLGVFLSTFAVSPGFRRDELACEEAVAHLGECCPNLDTTQLNCTYDDACGTLRPDFDVNQSGCIREASCEEIRARGLCDLKAADGDASHAGDAGSLACP
jgi:hypothetical protein